MEAEVPSRTIHSHRLIFALNVASAQTPGSIFNCELDSHADTCCAGPNFLRIDSPDDEVINVYGFNGNQTSNVPITTVATLYQDPDSGAQYILVFHQTLYFGMRIKTTLLNPNQLRFGGVVVNEVPRQFEATSTHDLVVKHDANDPSLRIPLQLRGVMSGFQSRKPTMAEYDDPTIPQYTLTVDEWDPNSALFAEKEELATTTVAAVIQQSRGLEECKDMDFEQARVIASFNTFQQGRTDSAPLDDDCLYSRMISSVNVASDDFVGEGLDGHVCQEVYPMDEESRNVMAITTAEKTSILTPEKLSQRWGIGLEAAKRTMKVTTQKGIRNVLLSPERRSRQHTSYLRFPNLKGNTYSDTMFSQVQSTRMNNAAQVFTNGLGFDRFYPLPSKGRGT